jgi:hypothetical protein
MVSPYKPLRACSSIKVGSPRHSPLLQSVYDRFSEGFETADLKTAKAFLNSWQ